MPLGLPVQRDEDPAQLPARLHGPRGRDRLHLALRLHAGKRGPRALVRARRAIAEKNGE